MIVIKKILSHFASYFSFIHKFDTVIHKTTIICDLILCYNYYSFLFFS